MNRTNVAQIRIIEAFLAVLIVFSAFTICTSLTPAYTPQRNIDLTSMGLQALETLDYDGTLGKHIVQKNWTAVQEMLSLVLPSGVSFNLTIYDEEMRPVNGASISNGGLISQEISFVEYICAEREPSCGIYLIYLYLARAS